MEQSSILSAKFDYPVVHQNFPLLATVQACEAGLLRTGRCPTGLLSGKVWLQEMKGVTDKTFILVPDLLHKVDLKG